MRLPLLAALAPLAFGPALVHADTALVLANEDYDALPDMPTGDRPGSATEGIAALGFDIVAVVDGDREQTSRALAQFMAAVPDSPRLIVALSGRFVTDGSRNWLMTSDSQPPNLFSLNSNAVSVESVMAVLARRPSRAVLLLGLDPDDDDRLDPWLTEGLGALDIPQGVTVITAEPREIAEFMTEDLAQPRGDLARLIEADDDLVARGYLPAPFRFMPEAVADVPPVAAPAGPTAAERALWEGATALGTVEAYRNYLRVYPQGAYREAARAAVAAIASDPLRAARFEEESLRLTREERRAVQEDLAELDFDPRGIDGMFGPGTRAAIVNWQQQAGYPQTSYLDAEQVARLSEQARAHAESEARGAEEARRVAIAAAVAADDALWVRTGRGASYDGARAYLERYPEGRHADEAQARIAAVEAAAQEAAAVERRVWDRAREADTAQAYARYLAGYPEGRWVDEARAAQRVAQVREAAPSRDDPIPGGRAAAEAAEAQLGLTPLTARVVEARLRVIGLDPGPIDGTIDHDTREALREFQRARDLPATGYLNERTLGRLVADTAGLRLGE